MLKYFKYCHFLINFEFEMTGVNNIDCKPKGYP